MEHYYLNIQGFFNFQLLYSEMVNKFPSGSHFVEVGSWIGMSAAYLGVEIVNSGKDIKLDCVDNFEGTIETQDQPCVINKTMYNEFLVNIEPLKHIINPIKLPSTEASKLYENESLDFVYIDAEHTEEAIKQDLKHWYPKVKVGGVFAGHDSGYPGIKKSLEEFFPNKDYEVRNCSSWIHYKK